MPTIIFKPANCEFDRNELFGEVFTEAPISVNYSFADSGNLITRKSKTVTPSVWDDLAALKDFPVIIHFNESDEALLRKHEENWSPVTISPTTVAVSAGQVLKVNGEKGEKYSDLKVFVDVALGKASEEIEGFVFTEQGRWLIENILTPQAAIIALDNNGNHCIYNEKCGYKFKEMWVFDSFLAELQQGRRQNVFCQEDWQLFCED